MTTHITLDGDALTDALAARDLDALHAASHAAASADAWAELMSRAVAAALPLDDLRRLNDLMRRTVEFLELADEYPGAAEDRRSEIAWQMRGLRLGNDGDEIPEALSDRLVASGGAFCGYRPGAGTLTFAQVHRLVTRWHS